MNIVLWVVQVALALFAFGGGAYKVFKFEEIARRRAMGAWPRGGWSAVGMLEMLCAVMLVVPAALVGLPWLSALAAAVLALESFALAGLYARHSLKLTAG